MFPPVGPTDNFHVEFEKYYFIIGFYIGFF